MKEFKMLIMTRALHLAAIFLVVFLVSLNAAGIVPSSWTDSGLFVGLVVLATFSAIRLSMDRNTWLPFLGPAVIPPSALAAKTLCDRLAVGEAVLWPVARHAGDRSGRR